MHPQERLALYAMVSAFAAAFFLPVPLSVWDAAWIPMTSDWAERKTSAVWWWGLEYTEIIIPDEPPIPAIGIVYLDWWAGLFEWVVSDAGSCPDGCPQQGVWNTH